MPFAPRRLVVGGGRAGPIHVWDPETEAWYDLPGMPHPRSKDLKLNIDIDAKPDIVGDINQAPFADQTFQEVFFENVTYEAFTGKKLGALNESARVLQPGGRLVIETGSGVKPHREAIRQRMTELGFKNVRVTEKQGGYRISGRLGGP
jgi:SAM-dependent methyltransferase